MAAGSPEVAGQPGSLFDRATDPWVSFGPTGVLHQISDSFNVTGRGFGDGSAILYSRSSDGGRTWSSPLVLREDLKNKVLNTSLGAAVIVSLSRPSQRAHESGEEREAGVPSRRGLPAGEDARL